MDNRLVRVAVERIADDLVVLPRVIGSIDFSGRVGKECIVAGPDQAALHMGGADGPVQLVPGGDVHPRR